MLELPFCFTNDKRGYNVVIYIAGSRTYIGLVVDEGVCYKCVHASLSHHYTYIYSPNIR